MLEHELYVILISKKQINGNVYPHKWAENLCTICFVYTKLVDLWLAQSNDIKEERKEYNNAVSAYSTTISDSVSAFYAASASASASASDFAYSAAISISDSASAVGYWKAQSQALFNALHKQIPQFKFDMFSAIDAIVNQKIQDKVNGI